MRLFLVRHGESVDNVAGLYAGSRDSALTNHGVQQARRLGSWLVLNKSPLTHIFASPLQRAYKTADALREAQSRDSSTNDGSLSIVKVEALVEQDFGYYEGKPFYARTQGSSKTGKYTHYDAHKDEPGFVDVESKAALATRCDAFLDEHLFPLLDGEEGTMGYTLAIVSHGILLSNLWRRLLARLPRRSLTIAPEVLASRSQVVLEHLGGWSNTGFLEILLQRRVDKALAISSELPRNAAVFPRDEQDGTHEDNIPAAESLSVNPSTAKIEITVVAESTELAKYDEDESIVVTGEVEGAKRPAPVIQVLDGYATTILTIDGKEHLSNLKRTRGGIGRARHDEKQKTMDSFFKRAKKE